MSYNFDFDYFDDEDFFNMVDNGYYGNELDLSNFDYDMPYDIGSLGTQPIGEYSTEPLPPYDFSSDSGYIDLGNSDYWMDGSVRGVDDESSSGLGGALNWVGKLLTGEGSGTLADLLYGGSAAYLMGNQVAQQNQNTDLLQKALSLQNASTQNAIKHSDINQFSALTNNAGNMTNNAYDVGRNGTRDALIAAVLSADKNLQGIDTSNFLNMSAQLRGAYEPVYQGFANDFVNRRNDQYPFEYASTAPFQNAAGGGGLNQVAQTPDVPSSFIDFYTRQQG